MPVSLGARTQYITRLALRAFIKPKRFCNATAIPPVLPCSPSFNPGVSQKVYVTPVFGSEFGGERTYSQHVNQRTLSCANLSKNDDVVIMLRILYLSDAQCTKKIFLDLCLMKHKTGWILETINIRLWSTYRGCTPQHRLALKSIKRSRECSSTMSSRILPCTSASWTKVYKTQVTIAPYQENCRFSYIPWFHNRLLDIFASQRSASDTWTWVW